MLRCFSVALLLGWASPAVAQEREWSLGSSGDDVFLAFGVPETADIGVSFWCKIGAKEVKLFAPEPARALSASLTILHLDVGGQSFILNPKFKDGTVEATLKPRDKVLAALKAADRFELKIRKHISTYPLAGADFDGLLAMCANKGGGVE